MCVLHVQIFTRQKGIEGISKGLVCKVNKRNGRQPVVMSCLYIGIPCNVYHVCQRESKSVLSEVGTLQCPDCALHHRSCRLQSHVGKVCRHGLLQDAIVSLQTLVVCLRPEPGRRPFQPNSGAPLGSPLLLGGIKSK